MSPRTRMGLLAFGLTGLLFAGIAVGVGVLAGGGREGVKATGSKAGSDRGEVKAIDARHADSWDARKLADYLRANGIPKLEMVNRGGQVFFLTKSRNVEFISSRFPSMRGDAIAVSDMETRDTAAAYIRSQSDRDLDEYFAWGKFVFYGSADEIDTIRGILK